MLGGVKSNQLPHTVNEKQNLGFDTSQSIQTHQIVDKQTHAFACTEVFLVMID